MNFRKFIVDAVCPTCHSKDSLYLQRIAGEMMVQCTECEYKTQATPEANEQSLEQMDPNTLIGRFKPD